MKLLSYSYIADIEQRDDMVGLEPRHRAEGGVGALAARSA